MEQKQMAEKLASRPYTILVMRDETTSGQPIFVAYTPELEGCIAQGASPEEAVNNLQGARTDFIESLLEDGLQVPEPQSMPTTTSSNATTFAYTYSPDQPSGHWFAVRDHPEAYVLTR